VPPVCQCEIEGTHIPIDVLLLLQPLDVQVRYGHGKSVVESYSAQRQRDAETGHAGHIFRDGDTVGVQLVQHLVGNHEVDHTLLINARAEVLVVAARETCADTVMCVNHARDTIEAETIKLVLFHPESQIAKQETEDFVVTIVEQPAVPQLVPSLRTLVEVLVIATIEQVEAVQNVLRGVAVNDIQ
jgi:hypothetical protein